MLVVVDFLFRVGEKSHGSDVRFEFGRDVFFARLDVVVGDAASFGVVRRAAHLFLGEVVQGGAQMAFEDLHAVFGSVFVLTDVRTSGFGLERLYNVFNIVRYRLAHNQKRVRHVRRLLLTTVQVTLFLQ